MQERQNINLSDTRIPDRYCRHCGSIMKRIEPKFKYIYKTGKIKLIFLTYVCPNYSFFKRKHTKEIESFNIII